MDQKTSPVKADIPPKAIEAEQDMEQGSTSTMSSGDENTERGNWTGKMDFLLSCLSYAVGLGNLWRFPYLCYRNGGGAFLIPYVVMLIFAGVPLFFMELAFGQFAAQGVISIWQVSPLMQGIGWGMFLVSCFIGVYYNMIIAWTLYYLGVSFNSQVPWDGCDNHWNTQACGVVDRLAMVNCTNHNGTYIFENHTCSFDTSLEYNVTYKDHVAERSFPSDEYFHRNVLGISGGIEEMGAPRWKLVLALLGAWTLVGMCLIRGIKSQGRAVYFTATFPYLVLTVLMVRGLTLPGSMQGILFYLTPQWHRLLTAKVWGDAAVQIFFSLSPCWGGLITLASYNKFHNNCLRDSLVVSLGNCLTSFFAGFVIFGIIGFMAHEMDLPVDQVADQGAGLAFTVYPEVVSRLPISPLWAILFFAMLATLGLGTQFSVVTTVHTTLLDVFPNTLRQGRRPSYVMVLVCFCGFLLGLTCTTDGGMYMVQLIDNYAATYSLLIIGLFECVTLSYIYGIDKFFDDIQLMLNQRPHMWWRIMWRYVTPSLLLFIMIFTWVDYQPSTYDDYKYPAWADAMGWLISMTSVTAIPFVMVINIFRKRSEYPSFVATIKGLSKPTDLWKPAIETTKPYRSCRDARIPLNRTSSSVVDETDSQPDYKVPLHSTEEHV